jgi:hypothetical protein
MSITRHSLQPDIQDSAPNDATNQDELREQTQPTPEIQNPKSVLSR